MAILEKSRRLYEAAEAYRHALAQARDVHYRAATLKLVGMEHISIDADAAFAATMASSLAANVLAIAEQP